MGELSGIESRIGGFEMLGMREAIVKLLEGYDLTESEARSVMLLVMQGEASPAQTAALLTALHMKGETVDEIAGCALAVRELGKPVRPKREDLVDISGTGGDRTGTFNISTTAALVVAGAGVGVAKHGARSVSSHCGSADLLEKLGVNLGLSPEEVALCIDEVGMGFLFAPKLHPAMHYAEETRREIGVRTVFDILGPLTNPAGATSQVLGVYAGSLTEPLAHVLSVLGCHSAYAVYGADGLDELSTTGVNKVSSLYGGSVTTFALDAVELGLPRAQVSDLLGGVPDENAEITRSILKGEPGPQRDVVVLNAAATLVVSGHATSLLEAISASEEAIDSGAAARKLEELVQFSQDVAGTAPSS